MKRLSFHPEFQPAILAGLKTATYRPGLKAIFQPGDLVAATNADIEWYRKHSRPGPGRLIRFEVVK